MTKKLLLLLAVCFLLASSLIITNPLSGNIPFVKAQTQQVSTYAYLTVNQDFVIIGENVTINVAIAPPPPTLTDQFSGLLVLITYPNQTVETIGPFQTTNSPKSIEYTPQELGTYTLQLRYPGESFENGTITYVYAASVSQFASFQVTAAPAIASTLPNQNYWVTKAPMQQARAGLGAVAVNGKIYAIGGSTLSGAFPPDMAGGFVGTNEEYDPATNNWTYRAPMPTPRSYFAIVAYQNKIYCIGGAVGSQKVDIIFSQYTMTAVNEVYDPATDTWQTKAPAPNAGMYLQAIVLNGKICLIDGNVNEVYDPANDSWTTEAASTPTNGATESEAAVLNNTMYLGGDFSSHLYSYDETSDSWSQGPTIPITSDYYYLAMSATTGEMALERLYFFFILSGMNHNSIINLSYDPVSGQWATCQPFPTSRAYFGVAVLNDSIYVIGGYYQTNYLSGDVAPVGVNEQFTPIGYGTPDPSYVLENTPPKISLLSPLNQTYNESSVPLVFSVDREVNWAGYSLDGQQNVTLTGNGTITGGAIINDSLVNMTSGFHSITIYANSTFGYVGASETINFTVAKPEPFPIAIVAAVSGAVAVVVVTGLLVYFKKRKRQA